MSWFQGPSQKIDKSKLFFVEEGETVDAPEITQETPNCNSMVVTEIYQTAGWCALLYC